MASAQTLLDGIMSLTKELYRMVGYTEGWREYVPRNLLNYDWVIHRRNKLYYWDTSIYSGYLRRCGSEESFICRAKDISMVILDTQIDGNIYAAFLDNSREKSPESADLPEFVKAEIWID